MIAYKVTKQDCEKGIKGVCEGCGRELSAIETVDNSGSPTHWQGCEHCSSFRAGAIREHFVIARRLVADGILAPYHHMRRADYQDTPERQQYYLEMQTAGLVPVVALIHHLLEAK